MENLQRHSARYTRFQQLVTAWQHPDTSLAKQAASLGLMFAAVAILTACSHAMMMMHGTAAKRPAATEFGFGPRSSTNRLYVATLETTGQLRPRQMQSVRVAILDGSGRPIKDASLTVDGGMPEHGHGLPTRPRMTKALGAGTYEIDGVRFNMGGWWEFRITIASELGTDTVTFNLSV